MKKLISFALAIIMMLGLVSFSVFADAAGGYAMQFSVKGINGSAEVYIDDVYAGETPYTAKIAKGTKVTLVSNDDKFICFADANMNTLTEEKSYTFTFSGESVVHVFAESKDKTMVIYRNTNSTKQILAYSTYSGAVEMETHFVKSATLFGKSFLAWDKTVDQIIALANAGNKTIYVTPTYTETTETCYVAAMGGTVNDVDSATVLVGSQITLVADTAPTGQKFAYWTNANGDVISDKATFTMYAVYGETYNAVFVDEDAQVNIVPSTSIKCNYLEDIDKIEIFTQRFIPEGATVTANGLLYVKDAELDEADMILDNVDGTNLFRLNQSIATYSGFVRNTTSCEEFICMRPFITYEMGGTTYTVYGSKVKGLKQYAQNVLVDEDFEELSDITVDSVTGNALSVKETSGLVIQTVDGNKVAATNGNGGYITFNGNKAQLLTSNNVVISMDLVLNSYPTSTMKLINFIANKTVNYDVLKLTETGALAGRNEDIVDQSTGKEFKLELNTPYNIEVFWDIDTERITVRVNGNIIDSLGYAPLVSNISTMEPKFFESGKGAEATIDNIKIYTCNNDLERVALSTLSNYSDVYLVTKTNKNAVGYAVGEAVTFEFEVRNGGMGATCEQIKLSVRTDSDNVAKTVYLDASRGKASYTVTLDEPGFVYIAASACNASGTSYSGSETANVGAGVGVTQITTAQPKPEDFEDFWQAEVDALWAIYPEIIEMTPIKDTDTYTAYKVKIQAVDDSAVFSDGELHDYVSGIITVPKNKTSLGLSLSYQSYSVSGCNVSYSENNITYVVDAHSIEPYEDDEYYSALKAGDLKSHGRGASANTSADKVYFKNMLLRDLQAVRFLVEYYGVGGEGGELWNGTTISLGGGSQGGFQAAATAGLAQGFTDINITSLSLGYPWLCDIAGGHDERITSTFWIDYNDYEAVQYFDTVFFGEYITCKTTITTGLGDSVARVTGVTALYNVIASPNKTITFVQNMRHDGEGVYHPSFELE